MGHPIHFMYGYYTLPSDWSQSKIFLTTLHLCVLYFFTVYYYYICNLYSTVLKYVFLFTVLSLCLLKQLQWLPVEWRIKFKIATLTFKALETGQPPYLAQQLCP